MKTKEEPNALEKEYNDLNMKLSELDEKELVQVSAGKKVEGVCPAGRTMPEHGCCRQKCEFKQYWVNTHSINYRCLLYDRPFH